MCDTFVYISPKNEHVIFGKNSDREPSEAQQIVRFPAISRTSNKIRTTYIEVEHPRDTFEVILSKPFQMWGAEMGCNEKGVVIGNEAVFTKMAFRKRNEGLTGMDMIRLALEISSTAKNSLENIISYVEQYGQDASGGYKDKRFYYHNSFIIADASEAFVLETAGRHWVYEKVKGFRAISNGLSIEENYDGISAHAIKYAKKKNWTGKHEPFNFRKAYSTWLMPKLAACDSRRDQSEARSAKGSFSVEEAFSILRSHAVNNFEPSHGTTSSICMHASGLFSPHQTVGSMVVKLRKENKNTVWLTGSSAPCLSMFKPFYFGDDVLDEENFLPPRSIPDNSYWWQWEKLHQSILRNYSGKIKLVKEERDRAEKKWIALDEEVTTANNYHRKKALSHEALAESIALRDKWLREAKEIKNKKYPIYDFFRKQLMGT